MAKKLKMYTVKGCPACAKARKYLKSKGANYEEIDVNDDVDTVLKIVGKDNPLEVPIICSKKKCEIGFDREIFDQLID